MRAWSGSPGTGGRCQQGRCCLKTEIRFDFQTTETSNPNRREFLRALDILCKYQENKNFLKTISMNMNFIFMSTDENILIERDL